LARDPDATICDSVPDNVPATFDGSGNLMPELVHQLNLLAL
jgi:hypothetical protein